MQTLNMVNAFAAKHSTVFISSWVPRTKFKKLLGFYGIEPKFILRRTPTTYPRSSLKPFQYLNMLVFGLAGCLICWRGGFDIIYTRDFSFIYFLSFIPKPLLPKAIVVYENHKLYHKTTLKVSYGIEKRALRVPDLFVSITQKAKNDLISIYNIGSMRIHVAPSATNLNHFSKHHNGNTKFYNSLCR